METSALSGLNVEDVFFEMGKLALERIESEKEELLNERNRRDNGVKIDNNGGGKNGGGNNSCCK